MNGSGFRWDAELYQNSSKWQFDLGMMAIERLAPIDGEKILEIGCGNAMTTIEIAKRIPNGFITAIELSKEMIKQANINLSNHKIKNVKILHMNALEIKFHNRFDAIFSNSAIHWILDLESMYAILYEALNQDGRMLIQTGLKEINILFKTLQKISNLPQYNQFLNAVRFPWRFLSIKETKLIFKKVGFNNIKVEPYSYKRIFKNVEDFINYSKAAALVPYLNAIPQSMNKKFMDQYKKIVKKMISAENFEIEMTRLFNYAFK